MGLPNVVDQARAILACGCTRKPQLEKHVQSVSFLGGSFGAQHKEIAIDMVPFVATFSNTQKYPWPPRWFIESLFYYIKAQVLFSLHKISTCISFQNIAWLSMQQLHCFL